MGFRVQVQYLCVTAPFYRCVFYPAQHFCDGLKFAEFVQQTDKILQQYLTNTEYTFKSIPIKAKDHSMMIIISGKRQSV